MIVGDVRRPLLMLLGAVGFVLLVACANVANLLLARGSARHGELAVRAALGAGRGAADAAAGHRGGRARLAGGALGLVLAYWGTEALVAAQPADIPRLDEIGLDGTVVLFTLGVALLTSLVFGMVPALQATSAHLTRALREGGRGGAGRAAHRVRAALVVAEMALAVVLLTGAGLLIRSFVELTRVHPGFEPHGAMAFRLTLQGEHYQRGEQIRNRVADLEERLRALARRDGRRVDHRAAAQRPRRDDRLRRRRRAAAAAGRQPGDCGRQRDARLLPRDRRAAAARPRLLTIAIIRPRRRSALINEAGASVVPRSGSDRQAREHRRPAWKSSASSAMCCSAIRASRRCRSCSCRTRSARRDRCGSSFAPAAIRSRSPARSASRSARSIRTCRVAEFIPLDELVARSVARPRFYTSLLTLFAAVALALAATGIFGVMSYTVAQRAREISIRMALGARTADVLRTVVGRALALAGVGVALGIVAALALGRVIQSQLFGVGVFDPLTLAAVIVVLFVSAGAGEFASGAPRRRRRSGERVPPELVSRPGLDTSPRPDAQVSDRVTEKEAPEEFLVNLSGATATQERDGSWITDRRIGVASSTPRRVTPIDVVGISSIVARQLGGGQRLQRDGKPRGAHHERSRRLDLARKQMSSSVTHTTHRVDWARCAAR